jgi:hypothetical protein
MSRHTKELTRRLDEAKARIRERAKGRIHQSQSERETSDKQDEQAYTRYMKQLDIDEAGQHRLTHFANGEKKLPAHVAAIKQVFEDERTQERAAYKHLQDMHKKIDKVFPGSK